jgi:hypothetical protein
LRDKTWKARKLEQAGWFGDETASAFRGKTLRTGHLRQLMIACDRRKTRWETSRVDDLGEPRSALEVDLEEQENPMRGATVEEANYRAHDPRL